MIISSKYIYSKNDKQYCCKYNNKLFAGEKLPTLFIDEVLLCTYKDNACQLAFDDVKPVISTLYHSAQGHVVRN